ncbi:C40 family peptidase [Jatrophihabitans sp. GAS493]|uniref:C40 family peptidase n=1 Tax=Jatrophihabitans sp. GAS493 TaxID=1907575 RepID=UPI000BB80F18|nr:C40 family peptidase [Jatrophihabitans sp. GAS493]
MSRSTKQFRAPRRPITRLPINRLLSAVALRRFAAVVLIAVIGLAVSTTSANATTVKPAVSKAAAAKAAATKAAAAKAKAAAAARAAAAAKAKARAVAHVAATMVGHRYRTGGTTPAGFDCSGLTQYSYKVAIHKAIPRTAQAQYKAAHSIPKSKAIAGDLVFFHSGKSVYHVGVYAGKNMMYAAATTKSGVRYQSIWSSAVTYGSFTH